MRKIIVSIILLVLAACGYKGDPLPPYVYTFPKNIEKEMILRPDELIIKIKYPENYLEGRRIGQIEIKVYKCNSECQSCNLVEQKTLNGQSNYIFRDFNYRENTCYVVKGKTSEDIEVTPLVFIVPEPKELETPKISVVEIKGNYVKVESESKDEMKSLYRRSFKDDTYGVDPIAYFTGEFVDRNVGLKEIYCYRARSVVMEGELRIESQSSNEVCINVADLEPPGKVKNLTAIYKDGSVFLIWDEPEDKDLEGFIVYKEIDGKLTRLNSEIIKVPTFIDEHPSKGVNRYAVTAIDTNGNEGEKSYIEIKIE